MFQNDGRKRCARKCYEDDTDFTIVKVVQGAEDWSDRSVALS